MRIASIEFFRFLAVYAVIFVHTKPFMQDLFRDSSYRLPEYLFNQPPRFAVPFFFITAGYFLAKTTLNAEDRWQRLLRYEKRIALLFGSWTLLYLVLPSFWPELQGTSYPHLLGERLAQVAASPFLLLFQGSKVHLWYLASLLLGVALLGLCTPGNRLTPALVVSLPLFVVGLLGGSYDKTPWGLDLPFSTRNGPFLSTICLLIGYAIFSKGIRLSPRRAALLIVIGCGLHVAESWFLWRYYQVSWLRHNYLIGTVVTAAGVLLLALALPELGRRQRLDVLGQYSVGVYLCHYLFVDILGPLTPLFELHVWQLVFPLLVYLLSVGLTVTLRRFAWSRAMVS